MSHSYPNEYLGFCLNVFGKTEECVGPLGFGFKVTWVFLFFEEPVLVFSCCCNKLPQTWWLKQLRFILFQFYRSEIQYRSPHVEIQVSVGLHTLWALQRRMHIVAFPSSYRPLVFLGLQHPSSIFRTSNVASPCTFLPRSHLPLTPECATSTHLGVWGSL